MNWKEVTLPALDAILSTGEAQPLDPKAWPSWARTTPGFSGAWFTDIGGALATSTGTLSTENVQAHVDFERKAQAPPPLRYYRYLYVKMIDGRVFQAGPFKDLEYSIRHHIDVDGVTSNFTFERPAGPHTLAASAQRARWAG